MAARIYYEDDADLSLLKDKTIAILGYGSQGHAQAQNLRDSGCRVVVAQRPGGANYELAISHGFEPMSVEEATKTGDLVNILLPDEVQGDVFREQIRPNLDSGNLLMCSHGFNIHFGQVIPPPGIDAALVAPKGPGHLVRSEYEQGGHDYPISFVRWTEQRNFEAVLDMLADRRIDAAALISHRFPLAQVGEAYELIGGSQPSLGVSFQHCSLSALS